MNHKNIVDLIDIEYNITRYTIYVLNTIHCTPISYL